MTNGPSGVCQGASGNATAFPTTIAMSCTFDTSLINRIGIALGKETYAKGKYILEGPMINMVRDPRGGRNWETFGEDPYLTAKLAVAYCKGVQSVGCVAMPKHFIANDMELNRNTYTSNLSERTLREIYAMPFEYACKEGKAWSVMSAYNKVDSLYSSDNKHILTDLLKSGWGFRGFVCSDWNSVKSTVAAANAGQDVEMPGATYFGTGLANAVLLNQVSQTRLSDMVKRLLRTKVWANVVGKLGESSVIQYTTDLKSAAHQQLALEAAQKSMVLVKNQKFGTETSPVLPLNKNTIATVAVVGPYAQVARYSGAGSGKTCPYFGITPLDGIKAKLGSAKVLDSAMWRNADVVIACVGVSGEGEGADRTTLGLDPQSQNNMISAIIAAGKKCVVVMTGGSAAVQDAWYTAPAVLIAWYPGQDQGTALADILFGDVNPSGKLSCSWPASASQLPAFSAANNTVTYEAPDTGRGYRYYDRCNLTPLFSFGYGLSYTTFQYSNLRVSPNTSGFAGDTIVVSVDITNTGSVSGDEVPQLYISENAPQLPRPVKELRGFARVTLAPAETKTVTFTLKERDFAYWDTRVNAFTAQPDMYTIMVGPSAGNLPLSAQLALKNPW
jgi:beta-glucosidase